MDSRDMPLSFYGWRPSWIWLKKRVRGVEKFEPYDFRVIWSLMMQYPPLTQFGQTNLANSIFVTSQPPLDGENIDDFSNNLVDWSHGISDISVGWTTTDNGRSNPFQSRGSYELTIKILWKLILVLFLSNDRIKTRCNFHICVSRQLSCRQVEALRHVQMLTLSDRYFQ